MSVSDEAGLMTVRLHVDRPRCTNCSLPIQTAKWQPSCAPLGVRLPGIVGADAPGVTFGIADGEFAAAIFRVLERAQDGSPSGYGARVDCVRVGDHDVDAAGFRTAQFIG